MATQSVEQRLATLEWLRGDLPAFAEECLRIRPKDAMNTPIVPLALNRTQQFVHAALEAQKARTGKVRVIIGKGRQTTVSTYVAARFYHKTTFFKGVHTYILTHEQDATDNLFGMVERFQEHNPLRPSTSINNAKELTFDRLGSSYEVGTAGTKAGGRSQTIQMLHWSETAFSPNAKGHFAGIVQTVPDLKGTEIILESTGNGPAGAYYEHWQDAEAGIGDYMALFVPWFWTPEYSRPTPFEWEASDEERQYQAAYMLTDGQMAWRRAKIIELKDPKLFKQEYPASAVEMFEATGKQSYIDPETVLAARKATKEGFGPLIVGVDPSRFGDDRFSLAWRRGRQVSKVESRSKIGTTEALAWLRDVIDQDRPARMFIDAGGGGDRLYDILESWGEPYSKVIKLVNFGGRPQTITSIMRDGTKRPGPVDRRAEMWMRSRDWLEQPAGADIPDSDTLQSDACAPTYTYQTTDQRLRLESKEQMRARGVRSPDEWDAVCFVAGTLIQTPAGLRRIETISVGDLVTTPFGPSEVMVRWESHTSSLTTANFSNGSSLSGKGEHRIFAWGDGAVRLDALSLTNEVEPYGRWRAFLWRSASTLFIEARNIGFKQAVATFNPGKGLTVSGFCTAAFGWTITALFQKVFTSITKIMTGGIAASAIWNCSTRATICATIWPRYSSGLANLNGECHIWHSGEPRPRAGTAAKRGWPGTATMGSTHGTNESPSEPSAVVAGGHIGHSSRTGRNFAGSPARRRKAICEHTTVFARAIGAARRLLRTAIGLPPVVPVRVVTASVPPTPVYNLTLKRHNAYYANGILAYNCLTFAEPVRESLRQASAAPVTEVQSQQGPGTGWLGV